MKIKTSINLLLWLGAVGLSLIMLVFVIGATWIGYSMKNLCKTAQWEYQGDCTTALIAQLQDEERGYKARNDAIWGLSQLGDERALPVLESYYTGNIPDREPLDGSISQYELRKAIKAANGGVNLTAIFWKHDIN